MSLRSTGGDVMDRCILKLNSAVLFVFLIVVPTNLAQTVSCVSLTPYTYALLSGIEMCTKQP